MPTFIVDPVHFHAEGALVNWLVAARRQGIDPKGTGIAIELRWMLKADRGLPTEPFIVWSRPHSNAPGYQALTITKQQLLFAGGVTLVTWTQGSVSSVRLTLAAPAPAGGATVFAFAGSPIIGSIVAFAAIPAGATSAEINAKTITSLVVSSNVTVNSALGLLPGGYANAPGWTPIEVVGLPVSLPQWSGIGKHGSPQGLIGAFTDAPTAAIARLTRGAPPFGWGPNIAAGVPAPPWTAPDFKKLVTEVNKELLDFLHDIVKNFAPQDQAARSVKVALPPPKNSLGQSTPKPGSTTKLFPLPMSYMAGSTDPFLSLVLGFGTAYPFTNIAGTAAPPVLDFMVTAHWEKGFDGKSAPVDYAAIIPTPGAPPAPPAPANMGTEIIGALRPLVTDGDWRESVRLFWDRPVIMQLFRIASCAVARVSTSPAQPAIALMEERTSGGFRPIVLNAPLDPPKPLDPEWWRVHVMDREIPIPSNPGTRQMKYGATMQDIYGQWSPWVAADRAITQPNLEPVRLANPKLLPVAPASGAVCATTLEFDFLWDWRIRKPKQISVRGRMYAAASHGDPPPSVAIPAGLDRALVGGGPALTVTFAGDVPSAPGATIVPVTEDGENQAASFGAAQGTNRRYRVKLTGLSLDFGATGFIGIALWAQGQENIAPNRLSPWPDQPLVTSTGDPRPPVVPIFHVTLGSIPDASGSSHVRIAWTPQPNTVGYFIYEATEASLLDTWDLPEPHQTDTLDARLLVLRNRFKIDPVRRPFHRYNAKAITGIGADIPLPKGSTGIHVFVVLGISAGQVESDWPSGPSPELALIAVAAPHITKPAAPMIEVQQFLDNSTMPATYRAKVLVKTRPGPRPAMVELYRVRVDDAAKEVDTMGPPLVRLQASAGPWNVVTTPDPDFGPYITTVNGVDAPPGSWRRVWYRATTWTKEDDTRGGLPGRSEASNAAWVVLPPPTGPVISPLMIGGGPMPPDITIQWTSAAPLKRTPLGPHQIAVRATVTGAAPLISIDSTLDALPHAQPAMGSGVWIVSTAAGVTTYRALIRRAAVTDAVSFAVRITDPIGRTGSQLITVPAGAVNPPPNLANLTLKKIMLPAPAHLVLTFTSSSPVKAPFDGPYVLRITGVPPVPVIFPPPLSLTEPLGSVPTKIPMPAPATFIVRGIVGPPFTYTLSTTANLKGFVVRITGPDGKFVEKSVSL